MAHDDVIAISGLEVQCVVGVYARERDAAQRLILDLELEIDTRRAGKTGRIESTIDYAALAGELSFLLESARFRMLETAAHAVAAYVLAPPTKDERRLRVSRARVKLAKPDALSGSAIPSISITRDASDFSYVVEQKKFGTVDVIFEAREAGVYRLNVAPKNGIPLHVHQSMRECEMMLSTGLVAQGEKLSRGSAFRWQHEQPHKYDNPTESWRSILCIDAPRFDPADEIEVQGVAAKVAPDLRWVTPEAIA